MIALGFWQGLLNGLGWVLSHIYDGVHNYGLSIIILTLGIRLLLLPLGLKQIRSMQAMQALQPQIKQLQQKYKGNKQKLNEEMMKLYKERGVNPLAGCLPLLLQIPVLIALYSVLRFPQHPPHLPEGSQLRTKIEQEVSTGSGGASKFLSMNLLCNAQQAGTQVKYEDPQAKSTILLDCGHGVPVRIPYYALGLLMVGSMYYQQRQMQRAAPPGASQQQQMLTRIMPLLSIFWGFIVPSGVILYWTTSNAVQIGQQYFLLRAGHIGPRAASGDGAGAGQPSTKAGGQPAPRPKAGGARAGGARAAAPARRGFFASMLDRAEAERARRQGQSGSTRASPSESADPPASSQGQAKPQPSAQSRPGGQGARSRKKRRKR